MEASTENKKIIIEFIKDHCKKKKLKQREISKLINISQPRVSALFSGKEEIDQLFSFDAVLNYLERIGYETSVKITRNNGLMFVIKRKRKSH